MYTSHDESSCSDSREVALTRSQVWNTRTFSFFSKNKYRGRELKAPDFPRVLRSFLSDGEELLIDHIPIIIRKLCRLARIIRALDGFRFYGCSLLLIYDGDGGVQSGYRRHVRAIQNFDHRNKALESSLSGTTPGTSVEFDEDDEYAEHRHRPTRLAKTDGDAAPAEKRSHSVGAGRSKSRQPDRHQSPNGHHPANGHENGRHSHHHTHTHNHGHAPPLDLADNTRRIKGEVNIRLVDFAHTTTGQDFVPFPLSFREDTSTLGKGYDTPVDPATGLSMARFPPKHPGTPDMGFLFGLKSVCESLRMVWEDEVGEVMELDGEEGDVFETIEEGQGEFST